MPIPENFIIYGRSDLLTPIADRQPPPADTIAATVSARSVTRSVTLHYTAGWSYGGWRIGLSRTNQVTQVHSNASSGSSVIATLPARTQVKFLNNPGPWRQIQFVYNGANQSGWVNQASLTNVYFGTNYYMDLDGKVYQCTEAINETNHVGGAPHFSGGFANSTSVPIEICRFGKIVRDGNHTANENGVNATYDRYNVTGYLSPIRFYDPASRRPTDPAYQEIEWCDFTPRSDGRNLAPAGTRLCFHVRKLPPGILCRSISFDYYYLKLIRFNDARNNVATQFPFDVIHTEEQEQSIIFWVKSMCEMNQIPKQFLRNPLTGKENPWIASNTLVRTSNGAVSTEFIERVKSFQGILAHVNLQDDRIDPGASLDYYRLKRGICDRFWFPLDLGTVQERALNYYDTANITRYLEMAEYFDSSKIEDYYRANENSSYGFFPVGKNRLWHGGIHIPTTNSQPVYTIANGWVVASRLTNCTANNNIVVQTQKDPGTTVKEAGNTAAPAAGRVLLYCESGLGLPRANLKYTLTVDGVTSNGNTNIAGTADFAVATTAVSILLTVDNDTISVVKPAAGKSTVIRVCKRDCNVPLQKQVDPNTPIPEGGGVTIPSSGRIMLYCVDRNGNPRQNLAYRFTANSTDTNGTTDSLGRAQYQIPAGASSVILSVEKDTISCQIPATGKALFVRLRKRTLDYSRCFVLVKHYVHTQDSGTQINYGVNSTSTMYSLYMHLAPMVFTRNANGVVQDFVNYPRWLTSYIAENKQSHAIENGEILFPNQYISLGDKIGMTGDYIINEQSQVPGSGGGPQFGKTVHIECFTTDDATVFPNPPWSSAQDRIIDTDQTNIVANLEVIDRFIKDSGGDGIDIVDIKNAAPLWRKKIVKHKSEWSIKGPEELAQEVIVNDTNNNQIRKKIGVVVSEEKWRYDIEPLIFHPEAIDHPLFRQDTFGPFHSNVQVWHIHPLTMADWMNKRVDIHETVLREQDKPMPAAPQTNIIIENSFIVRFQNLGGPTPNQVRAGQPNYPEASHSGNTFEINVNELVDIAALTVGTSQTATRFHLHLLEMLDMINDRPHAMSTIEGYVSTVNVQCSNNRYHAAHQHGKAVDVRPGNPGNIDSWYNIYLSAVAAKRYIAQRYNETVLIDITSDTVSATSSNPSRQDLDHNAAELNRRLFQAESTNNATLLTQNPPIQFLPYMRLHIGYNDTSGITITPVIEGAAWTNTDNTPFGEPLLTSRQLRLMFDICGIPNDSDVNFFVFSRQNPTGTISRDIVNSTNVRTIYGNLIFPVEQMLQHESRPNTQDRCIEHIVKKLTGVNSDGRGTIVIDWISPTIFPPFISSFYIVTVIAANNATISGPSMAEHLIGASSELQVPKIRQTFWASDASHTSRITQISRSAGTAYCVVDCADFPDGFSARCVIRNTKNNAVVTDTTQPVPAGTNNLSLSWALPGKGSFHCSVTASKTGETYVATGGAPIEIQ